MGRAGGFEILVPMYQIQQCHSRRMIWKSVSYGVPPYQTQPVSYHHMMCSYLSCHSILTIVTSYGALNNCAYVVNLHVFIF